MIYALVARQDHVLAEYTNSGLRGNFSTVTRYLLKKIPTQDSKLSYVYDKYVFHYVVSDSLTYLVMTDGEFSRQTAFKFLAEVQRRFVSTYGDRGKTAIAFAFNADFQRVLQSQMDQFNAMRDDSRLQRVEHEVTQVREVMIENIDKVLERGERIELLVDRTDQLDQHAFKFKKQSTQLRRAMWWQNTKLMVLIGLAVIVLIYIILALSCGGMALKKCTK